MKYKVFAYRRIHEDGGAFESRLEYKGNSLLKTIKAIIKLRKEKIYCINLEWYYE